MFSEEEIWETVENFLKKQESRGSSGVEDDNGNQVFYSLKEILPIEELTLEGKDIFKITFNYMVVNDSEEDDQEFTQFLIIDQRRNIIQTGEKF